MLLNFIKGSKATLPNRMGTWALQIENGIVSVLDKRLKIVTELHLPFFQDNGADKNLLSLTNTTIQGKKRWRGLFGTGTEIVQEFAGGGRQSVRTVKLTDTGISVDYAVTYHKECDVQKEGYTAIINYEKIMADKLSQVVSSGNVFEVLVEDGAAMRKRVFFNNPTRTVWYDFNTREENEERSSRIQLVNSTPCLESMLQPNGRQATLVWTNHADAARPESTRAVMFGTSDTESPDYGTKGFVGHNIRTTWSVFYETVLPNVYGVDNAEYAAVIDEVHAAGHDVCPHRTRTGAVETREDAINHLPYYNTHFQSRDWIDHGLGAGARNIGLASLGWNSESEYYIMDLLEQYGYEYAWAYFDIPLGEIRGLNHRRLNYLGHPYYLLYQNTNLTQPNTGPIWQYISWRTPVGQLLTRLTNNNISKLIDELGVTIIHEYAALHNHDGYFYTSGEVYEITPEFEVVLSHLETAQNNEELWMPPMSEFGDYLRQIYQAEIEAVGKGEYKITSNSGGTISGYSVLAKDYWGTAKLNDVPMQSKSVSQGTIFWADLPVGVSTVTLQN